jgi:hypothetical protein
MGFLPACDKEGAKINLGGAKINLGGTKMS